MLHPADVSQKSPLLYAAKLPVTAQLLSGTLYKDKNTINDGRIFKKK